METEVYLGEKTTHPWWVRCVIYSVYVRAFSDSNGDGWGDLAGICSRLPYLANLGVQAVMICPFYPSPMYDGGCDITDHCGVDPRFGSLDDVDRLVSEAHASGLKVLIDFVGNHVSNQHPWFLKALGGSLEARRRFILADRPNGWISAIKLGSAWTYSEELGCYYLHSFLPEQPDLNWRDKRTREDMLEILSFWLARGIDGFRVDAAHNLAKDPRFVVGPDEDRVPLAAVNHQPETRKILRAVSRVTKSFGADRLLVGEVFLEDPDLVSSYCGGPGVGLDMTLNFGLIRSSWSAGEFFERIQLAEQQVRERGIWPTWVLSNHDRARHRTRFGGSDGQARIAATILLSLRGTPVLYQGEELGLLDAEISQEMRLDPNWRVGSRAPIPWTDDENHGWNGAQHPLPWPENAGDHNAESLAREPTSILSLYRHLLRLRRATPALHSGDLVLLSNNGDSLAYQRVAPDGTSLLVACNFGLEPIVIDWLRGRRVLCCSWMVEGVCEFGGTVGAESAVILQV